MNTQDRHQIQNILSGIEQCIKSLSLLENNYAGKHKGEIYQTTRRYNMNKLLSLKKALDDFGKGTICIYKIQVMDYNDNVKKRSTTIELAVPSDISLKDIDDRLRLSGIEVISIMKIREITMGFPPTRM